MTRNKKIIITVCAIAITLILAAGIFFGSAAMLKIDFSELSYNGNVDSAGPVTNDEEGDYEFVFTGSTEIADQTYNVTLYGNKDEGKTVSLKIEELPMVELTGSWVFVEGKGYKIYFDDATDSFAYTKYDPETKLFSFNYNLNLGDTSGGSGKVAFTCKNEAFADEYDGVGLGNVPPIFTGYSTFIGAVFALKQPVACLLTCYEDGTCVSISTNEVKFATERNGAWEYDSATNVYTFTFEDEPFVADAERGSVYYKFNQEIIETLPEDTVSHWNPMESGCYWDQVTITENPGNTFQTVYDEETNTYFLLYEHGYSGANEFADRYVSWSPDDV